MSNLEYIPDTRFSVESLLKLHRKVKSIDNGLDGRTELSSARGAWNEVLDNVERGWFHFTVSSVVSYIVMQKRRPDKHFLQHLR